MAIGMLLGGLLTDQGSPVARAATAPAVRIDAGSTISYHDHLGQIWEADRGFTGGLSIDRGNVAITGTADARLDQTEHYGMSSYNVPVANGHYTVRLHFAETFAGITAAGQRVFGVQVEGTSLGDIDVFKAAGGSNRELIKSLDVNVTTGSLDVAFTTKIQSPMLNALEIVPIPPTEQPYPLGSTPQTVPGRIEAENYDLGGEGLGYHDLTPGNLGGIYRQEDVDLKAADGGLVVGWFQAGEWLAYTVNVAAAGRYDITARAGSASGADRALALSLDGAPLGTIAVPQIADWVSPLGTAKLANVALPAGKHVLRVTNAPMDWVDFNWIDITAASTPSTPTATATATNTSTAVPTNTPTAAPTNTSTAVPTRTSTAVPTRTSTAVPTSTSTAVPTNTPAAVLPTTSTAVPIGTLAPYGGTSAALPGTIQASNYDLGGEGVAYHDLTPGNAGNVYRTDDVDLKQSDGGVVVGWFQKGEWLSYSVKATAGTYNVVFRTGSSSGAGRVLALDVDGVRVGTVAVPILTVGTDPLQEVTLSGVSLSGGAHVLRVTNIGADWADLNWLRFDTAAVPEATVSLQSLIDAAAPGSTLLVPAAIYHETININKPMTLDGQNRAEIHGSDIWTGWTQSGSTWTKGPVPALPTDGDNSECVANTNNRCQHAEQVFVDGTALAWVLANPASGQFALDGARNVILADNPTGHKVEVTTRSHWANVQADNVTIQGFTMRHAGSAPNVTTALGNQGHNGFTLQNNTLSFAHGSVVSIDGGSGARVLHNDVSHGGQIGISGWAATGTLIQGNKIHDNVTDGYNPAWAAGGLKVISMINLLLDGNEAWSNAGPALWCDISCSNATISNNRIHNNPDNGIFFEISDGASVFGNVIWDSTGGASIAISSSGNANVHDNVVVRSPSIRVWQDNRPKPASAGTNDQVHDNSAVATTDGLVASWWAVSPNTSGNTDLRNVMLTGTAATDRLSALAIPLTP